MEDVQKKKGKNGLTKLHFFQALYFNPKLLELGKLKSLNHHASEF